MSDCWNTHRRARRPLVPGAGAARALPQLSRCTPPAAAASCSMATRRPATSPSGRLTSRKPKPRPSRDTQSVVIFRIGAEWLALPTAVRQGSRGPPSRFTRCRTGASGVVLGVANVRGELLVCVSLGQLLGLERVAPSRRAARASRPTSACSCIRREAFARSVPSTKCTAFIAFVRGS